MFNGKFFIQFYSKKTAEAVSNCFFFAVFVSFAGFLLKSKLLNRIAKCLNVFFLAFVNEIVACGNHVLSASLEGGEAGFYFELEDGKKVAISFNRERGLVEFGDLINGWATCTPFRGLVSQPFNVSQHSNVKIFARRWFIEVYVNGRYATSLRTDSLILPNRAGIYANGENCVIDNLKIIEMK